MELKNGPIFQMKRDFYQLLHMSKNFVIANLFFLT